MARRGTPIPQKLKQDAILEAVFEIRFDTTTIPEILFGRLADYDPWRTFAQRRLPTYEIPAPIRQLDPNLRHQPLFELAKPEERRAIRIGQRVLSYHQMSPYCGWRSFKPDLEQTVQALFSKADALVVNRLGLRYLNALRSDVHGIRSLSDLDLELAVAGDAVSGNVNVNFTTSTADDIECTVRLASPEFVIKGDLPANTSVFIDVDVFTKPNFKTRERAVVAGWLEPAHAVEKEHFFRLLKEPTIESLKEE